MCLIAIVVVGCAAEGVLGHFGGGFTRLRTAEGYCVPVLDGFSAIRQTPGQPDTLINYVHTK